MRENGGGAEGLGERWGMISIHGSMFDAHLASFGVCGLPVALNALVRHVRKLQVAGFKEEEGHERHVQRTAVFFGY